MESKECFDLLPNVLVYAPNSAAAACHVIDPPLSSSSSSLTQSASCHSINSCIDVWLWNVSQHFTTTRRVRYVVLSSFERKKKSNHKESSGQHLIQIRWLKVSLKENLKKMAISQYIDYTYFHYPKPRLSCL